MSCSEQLVFLKDWSFYLKKGELRCVDAVLRRNPANPSELAFHLEVAAQLCMLKSLALPYSRQSSSPGQSKLPNFHSFSQHLLTKDYIRNLISIHCNITTPHLDQGFSSILVRILGDSIGLKVQNISEISYQSLKNIGRLCYLLSNDSNLSSENMLRETKDRWSTRKMVGKDWRDCLVTLLILWSTNQAKNEWMGDVKSRIQDEAAILMSQWLESITYLLENINILRQFSEGDLIKLTQQSKNMAKALKLKSNKSKKQILIQIKKKMFEKCTLMTQKRTSITFGYYFTIINAICSQVEERIQNIIALQDVINNETLHYCSFWELSKLDLLQYLPSFSNFMRGASQQNILAIYQKVNSNLALADTIPIMTKQMIIAAILSRNKNIFQQFNVQPITTSRVLLENYLQFSGVPLPKTQRYYNKRQRQTKIMPIIADPLHFMMIAKHYWQDGFHRAILEIALWMSLDAYCKWIQRQKLRDIQEKQTQQYIKKLNIAVAIFFFSLDHPTHLLQYQPVESDCLKQLFIQNIFPSLILNCKYFFASYNWQTRKIINKVDNGLENWVLPWAHLLNNPKNLLNFIYFERGYELAHKIVTQNRLNFDRIFGDFFNTRILTELQGLGINLTNGQAEIKQKLAFINPQRKKYMILLLRQSEKGNQKVSHTARRILQILA